MKRIIWLHFLVTIKVEVQGWQQCILVSMLVMEAVLIAEDMGVLLICNLLQSQDASIQTNVSESRVLRSDSEGIRTLPGTEGRRVGSTSGR